MDTKISIQELSKHSSPDDGWIVINGNIWDVTEFAPKHPGGPEIINEYLGQDASAAYNEVHGPSLAGKYLDTSCLKGRLDLSTVTEEWKAKQASNIQSTSSPQERPPLESIINMYDFEAAAEKVLSAKSWAFMSAAANDSLTKDSNIDWWRKIWFRPRVLVGVKNVDTSCKILGEKFSLPLFNSPAALAKLSHDDGELAMARGLVAKGSTIIVCHNASFSYPEVVSVLPEGYPTFYQLYFHKDRATTEKLMTEVAALKPRAVMVTVDLPVVGKREADERVKIETSSATGAAGGPSMTKDKKGSGLARATGSFIDSDLQWKDIKWLMDRFGIPVFLKGIQCAYDAKKALDIGCAGIFISNHGGRAVDTAQPSLLTLMEINANCPEVLEQMEVFIDGGIRRGTDVLKAICLGASGCCMGRPFHFAVGYGQEGVEHAIDSEYALMLPKLKC